MWVFLLTEGFGHFEGPWLDKQNKIWFLPLVKHHLISIILLSFHEKVHITDGLFRQRLHERNLSQPVDFRLHLPLFNPSQHFSIIRFADYSEDGVSDCFDGCGAFYLLVRIIRVILQSQLPKRLTSLLNTHSHHHLTHHFCRIPNFLLQRQRLILQLFSHLWHVMF